MTNTPHWAMPATWTEARALVTFEPRVPALSVSGPLEGLRVFIRNHKMRDVPIADRTIEARYSRFGFSQVCKGVDGARHAALDVSYGAKPRAADVSGHGGRMYDRGPVPEPDDVDGQMPAVVVWHDGDMLYFLASHELDPDDLLAIGRSIYAADSSGRSRG